MSLHSQDWINIAIAAGTCAAACFSYKASDAAKKSNESSIQQFREQQKKEDEKWLTSILQSLALQCNEEVSKTGVLNDSDSSISRIATLSYNAIDFVNRYSTEVKRSSNLRNFWCFLHSSVWSELKGRQILNSKQVTEEDMIIFPGAAEFYSTVKEQYDFVEDNLIKVLSP
ncbi:hypothetical protein GKC68_10560 [Pantoea sp. RSPAM1]|uniref:hypothetical protein n=1 Tax=Pantoea sp. RSPAM1 TaxID=2675223 RepID=UPI00315D73E3